MRREGIRMLPESPVSIKGSPCPRIVMLSLSPEWCEFKHIERERERVEVDLPTSEERSISGSTTTKVPGATRQTQPEHRQPLNQPTHPKKSNHGLAIPLHPHPHRLHLPPQRRLLLPRLAAQARRPECSLYAGRINAPGQSLNPSLQTRPQPTNPNKS